MPLRALTARLRKDCPWDRLQTFESARPYLLEETYEVLAALDEGSLPHLKEELGDLLFQVYFIAELASEAEGGFTIDDVARAVAQKMVDRHPHVFPPLTGADEAMAGTAGSVADAEPVHTVGTWEARKARTRRGSRVDGVPPALPSLLRAHRVGEKLAHVGFDWPDVQGVLDKVAEEQAELIEAIAGGDRASIVHEYGDLLLACASLGRFLGVSGEDALREANLRFEGRFRGVEQLAQAEGVSLEAAGPAKLEGWWREVKAREG